jgi:signal transduction histidine kinase
MFRLWFPDTPNTREYDTDASAFAALDHGEVDLIMATKNRLLSALNFYEMPNYKANYLFNNIETSFVFNRNQEVLRSIIDKALPLIDTGTIVEQWMTKTYDYRAKVAEGRQIWIIGASSLAFIVLLTLVIYIKGILDKRRLTALVAEQTYEAQAASEAKSRFVANMSHEMRTPMNVIIGLTDLVMEEEVPASVKETLRKINTPGSTLMGLINDVLDISKIEAGKLDLTPVQYDTASFLNDIITLNMVRIGDKPIVFKLDLDETLPEVLQGDELRLRQIMNNLLSNAFKYTEKGTVSMSVTHQRQESLEWLTFSITDTGIGIREEDLPKLFTDYNMVNRQASRKVEGTGLGLSITKKIVELMGGQISVSSIYGQGSTFTARLSQGHITADPIGKEVVESLCIFRYQDKKKPSQGKTVRADLRHARALVVDDFPTNLDVAAGMLRKYKMQVDCADNGKEAVDIIASGQPIYNIIFMDHMMPVMDGVEATKTIRALNTPYAKNIPIVALTANAIAGYEQMFMENGFNAFLPKPFNVMTLDAVITQWVVERLEKEE